MSVLGAPRRVRENSHTPTMPEEAAAEVQGPLVGSAVDEATL
jgi:hypothetical protein